MVAKRSSAALIKSTELNANPPSRTKIFLINFCLKNFCAASPSILGTMKYLKLESRSAITFMWCYKPFLPTGIQIVLSGYEPDLISILWKIYSISVKFCSLTMSRNTISVGSNIDETSIFQTSLIR